MINRVEKKNPKRRFKEFLGTGNWNVRTLGTVLMSMYNGQTPSRSKVEYWNGKINWLTSGELNCGIVNDTIEKITESGLDSANLKVIPKGILVIAITGLEASGTRGNCAILGCDTTLNQSCMALFPMRSIISSDFLFNWYLFIGDYYGIKYTQGTKQQSYNSQILNDLEIVMPSLDEQNKISSFFSKMDSMINLQQRKLDKLQATKKALLQEMFPEEGQDTPKRRFKGFTDAWEQRKLGEYANFRRGSFPQPYGNKEWYDGVDSAPFVQVVDVGDNLRLVDCTKQRISKLAQPMSVYAEKGSVLVTLQGSIGRVAVSQYDAFIDRTILIFQGYKYKTNPYFWAYIIKGKFSEEALKAPGGTIKTITKEALSNFIILHPKFSEQEQIGSFFEKLDKLITLHQRKLDKLKNLKQAYLNEMFV
jgi:type I R/M system specificity subunit